jgi:hypothetical protein
MRAAPRKTTDTPNTARGAVEREGAAPFAGGASADPVGEALELAAPERLGPWDSDEEVAEAKPELTPDVIDMVPLRPIVELMEAVLEAADASLEAVLLMDSELVDDSALSSNMAWMRISWHWAPIHSS